MHPLVAKGEEMKFLRELTDRTAREVIAEKGVTIEYQVGTMVELPRAAIRAADLAQYAEFFSFGTNDLPRPPSGSAATIPAASSTPTSRKASSSGTLSSASTRRASAT
jgi:hypothetical protein